ncbi:MAG TPA: transcription termination factor Rho [Acidimicrobiales bacterium]|nr:transcription termination factor Rho [Acidimicrobiales bacterium]
MSGEQLERSILERKEREELKAIATAMSLEPGARLKKADLVDQILRAAGVEVDAVANGAHGGSSPSGSAPEEGTPAVVVASAAHEADAATNGKAAKPRATRARTAKAKAPVEAEAPDSSVGYEEGPTEGESPAEASTGRAFAPTGRENDATADGLDAPRSNGSGVVAGAARFVHEDAFENETLTERPERPDRSDRASNDRGGNQQQTRHQRQQGGGQGLGTQGGGGQGQQNQNAPVEAGNRRSRRRRGRDRVDRELQGGPQADAPFSGELVPVKGLLDLREEGYGFLRTSGYLPSVKDVYVSVSQARRFSLRRGDAIEGACRPAGPSEKYPALLRIDSINGMSPDDARERPRFEDLTPLFPDERLRLENREDPTNVTARIIDLISPIGKGQRGMIVSPSKAGKTTIMKQIAHSVELNNPSVHLMVLLVDERPEEVTDMRRSVKGEVIASTFDRPADEHTALSELTMERAKRLVEMGRDVVIILDGITRLARAYNLAQPATGRIMSGGVDSGALYPPKKFFGAARNVEEGGSLTILATALIETGSKMDEVIFEEFKGTGNMELRLDRKLAERRIYPAIDVNASSTRHEELLFDRSQLQQVWKLRRVLNALGAEGSAAAGLELLVDKIKTTRSNDEFLAEIAKAPTPSN